MIPIQITLRNVNSSPALESHIRKNAEKLNKHFSKISSCRIVLETPKKHSQQGKVYNARIDITVPGKEFVATHKRDQDIYVVIKNAFSAIKRQLEDHSRIRHGHVKTHPLVNRGFVSRMNEAEGYGFIEGVDGHEYYFNMINLSYPNALQLAVGDAVEFIPQTLSEGRQASHILLVKGRHNIH